MEVAESLPLVHISILFYPWKLNCNVVILLLKSSFDQTRPSVSPLKTSKVGLDDKSKAKYIYL